MFKRTGILALLLSSMGAALVPQAAQAQDRSYYYGQNYPYFDHRDRDWARQRMRDRRERDRWERCTEDRRERQWRRYQWREQQRRYRYRFDRPYSPGVYFGFSYR